MSHRIFLLFLTPAMLLFLACSEDTGVDSGDDSAAKVTVTEASCSECGGFIDVAQRSSSSRAEGEHLAWSYDPEAGELTLRHNGLMLNCCGIHSVSADYREGVITITEDDQPTPEGRCRCECSYDFLVSLKGLETGVCTTRIVLTVDQSTSEHWSGEFDLSAGGGVIAL